MAALLRMKQHVQPTELPSLFHEWTYFSYSNVFDVIILCLNKYVIGYKSLCTCIIELFPTTTTKTNLFETNLLGFGGHGTRYSKIVKWVSYPNDIACMILLVS